MTFEPVLPPALLAVAAGALIALRMVALRAAAGTGRRAVLRWSTTTGAMLLILLAAARPVSGAGEETEPGRPAQTGANVYFVVDRSADSAATDPDGRQRMAQMREDIGELIAAHPGARFALIAFAARPSVDWPLSDDIWSLQPVVETLTPYAGPAADPTAVNAAAAANVLRYQLIAAGQQYPGAPDVVYYLGSGAPESAAPQGTFETPPVDGGAVLGYGSGRGEATLRAIADQLGVPFVPRASGGPLPADTVSADTAEAAREPADVPTRVEFYWVFTMLAGLLLLVEIYLTARDLLRARATRREVLS
jgi:Ca-activated chloride channel family protein